MKDQINTIRGALEAVLCDPEGKCCIDGSDADRAEVDKALTALAQLEAMVGSQEPVGAVLYLDGQIWDVTTQVNKWDHLVASDSRYTKQDLYAAPVAQQPQYPLPDDLYPSKDWAAGSYSERVEWLHTMYEGQKALAAEYERQLGKQPQAEAVPSIEQERKEAEQQYSITAFNYPEAPIGSRDWVLYWAGWLARSTAFKVPKQAAAIAQQKGQP